MKVKCLRVLYCCWSVIKLSSSIDTCVFTELLLSEVSLVKGEYVSDRRGSVRRFNFYSGVKRLGKCRWAEFGVGKFVRGLDI